MKKKTKNQPNQKTAKTSAGKSDRLPIVSHLQELRRRLMYIAVTVVAGSLIAYGLERKIIALLLRPSHGQHFIYTSPLGGMNFLFGVCLDIGLIVATPVIIYQLLAFLQPLMLDTTRRFLLLSAAAAGFVACAGVLFGYYIGLPSALNFLLHQFTTTLQVRPLITIQSYLSFVKLYLLGSAIMFQLPLILLIINRIKPLKPGGLFKYERHLIVAAFVIAFIMNPTPNLVDQLLVVGPIVVMYQVGIGLIWAVNRRQRPNSVQQLREQDAERRMERIQHIETLRPSEPSAPLNSSVSSPTTIPVAASTQPMRNLHAQRPRQYAGYSPQRRLIQL